MRVSVLPRAARLRRALSAGLTRPILGAFALVLVVVTGMFALQLVGAREQHDEGESARHAEQVLRVSSGLERRVIDLETGLRGYLLTGREGYLEPYMAARDSLPAQLDELVRLSHVTEQDRRARTLKTDIESYLRSYAAPLRADGLVMPRADMLEASALGKRKVDALRASFAVFNAAEQRRARRSCAGTRESRTSASDWAGMPSRASR